MNSETYTSVPFIVSKSTAELWYRKPDVPGHRMIAGVPRDKYKSYAVCTSPYISQLLNNETGYRL